MVLKEKKTDHNIPKSFKFKIFQDNNVTFNKSKVQEFEELLKYSYVGQIFFPLITTLPDIIQKVIAL